MPAHLGSTATSNILQIALGGTGAGTAAAAITALGGQAQISGQATLNFGAFPGASDTSLAIADAAVVSTSVMSVRLQPAVTADHSIDEHRVETIQIVAGAIVAGVGFTIYAQADGPGLLYGAWSVSWVRN